MCVRTFIRSILLLGMFVSVTAALPGYPLDGYVHTGIRRLKAYDLIQQGKLAGHFRLQPGALLGSDRILLRLADTNPDFDISPASQPDPNLQAALDKLFQSRDQSYRAAVLDITDPAQPRYAQIRGDQGYIPGSVGKLLVMTGLFEQLRLRHPGEIESRERLLRETQIVADRFVIPNSHAVPVVGPDFTSIVHRSIQIGDRFSLWEWLDHMISPSSNAAASMVWKQALLMDAFEAGYPISPEREAAYLASTPGQQLSERAIEVIETPLRRAGLDPESFRVRTFFTATASRAIPGKSSTCTPNQILRWLIKLEQGRLVDRWSSLEMKKLIYFTRRRYRYASAPALNRAAVFFKSGSLYRCAPEEGYKCVQYQGNVENLMHSVAIVESPRENAPPLVYLVSIMSNVLKVNSAQEHQRLGAEIERLIQQRNS